MRWLRRVLCLLGRHRGKLATVELTEGMVLRVIFCKVCGKDLGGDCVGSIYVPGDDPCAG